MKYLSFALICLCANAQSHQVNLDSCSLNLQCGGQSTRGGSPFDKNQLRGPPGKSGPPGLKGEKGARGDRAERCECDGFIRLRKQFKELQEALNKVQRSPPTTCKDVSPRRQNETGDIIAIYPFAGWRSSVLAYCDHVTAGGGWMVFQRRMDGSEDFNRNWNDYVNGFGNLHGEFWMGLENLYLITSNGQYELRVDMEDFEGNKSYASYSNFSVGPGTDYTLTIGGFSGPAGNSMNLNGTRFSTRDRDQDIYSGHCAISYKGGGWFNNCHSAHPNGLYHGGDHESYADGVNWRTFRGYHHSLKTIEMKIRRK